VTPSLGRSLVALLLAALLGWPALATVLAAWRQSPSPAGGGLIAPPAAGSEASHVPRPLRLAATSLRVVLGTEAIALPLGVPLAFLLFRSDLWGRRVGIALAASLVFVPLPLVATAWLGALGNAGRAQALGFGPILTGVWGAAFLHAMAGLPWVVLVTGVGLCAVEPELEEAALLDLPAWRVVTQVALRRSAGALAGAALVLAVITAGDMTVTDLLQVRTYAEEAYVQYQLGHGLEAAAAVTLVPLVVLGTLVALMTRGVLGVECERLASAVARAKLWRLGRWRFGVGLLVAVTAGSVVLLPLYSLIWWAGRVGGKATLGRGPSWSISGLAGTLRAALGDAAVPLGTSLLWSALGAAATVALAWTLAWVSRTSGNWRYVVAGCAALTLATPGPVTGMALVVAYIQVPLLYNSPMLIVLADLLRTLPFCLLVLWPAVGSIPIGWLEAAAVDGCGPWRQITRVAVPATRDAALAAWFVAFALALGELPATNLVAPPGTTPLTVVIWGLLHTGVESQLAGVALVLLAAVAVPGGLAAWTLGRLARRGLPRD
jgi:iron(III) transport system permease protein